MAEDYKMKSIFAKLNGENYFNWKFKMEMLLRREKLWKYITDNPPTIPNPAPSNANADAAAAISAARLEATTSRNAFMESSDQARALIGLCIEDGQVAHIRNASTAKQAWEALRQHHERDTLSNKVSIIRRISRTQLQEKGDMEKHLEQLVNLFQKLSDLGANQLDDEWKVGFVLSSLPPSYDSLVTALEVRDDLTFSMVHSKLISEHLKRKNATKVDDSSNGDQTVLKTTHQKLKCFFCKKPSHLKKDCHKYKEWLKKSNNSGEKVNKVENNEFCFQIRTTPNDDEWLIDSGATAHVTNNKRLLDSIAQTNSTVTVANDSIENVSCKGNIVIDMVNEDGEQAKATLTDVLYAPKIHGNLISVKKLMDKGYAVTFDDGKCAITKKEKQVAVADQINGLFKLRRRNVINACKTKEHSKHCIHYWHRVFGHRDPDAIKFMSKNNMIEGLQLVNCGLKIQCETCMKAKLTRLPFPKKSRNKSKEILDLIHTDICGPMQTESLGKKRYVLTLIDDFSKFTTIHFLREKSETAEKIKEFVAFVKNKFNKKPKVIRSDRGGEFIGKELKSYLRSQGIKQQFTAPYTPQQNGIAERKNRSLIEMARCLLEDSGLPKFLWAEAVNTANFIQNRTITKGTASIPIQSWSGIKPMISHMQIFGTKCFAHVPEEKRRKLDNTAKETVFIGYEEGSKAYRLYDKRTHKLIISRDVRFIENPSHSSNISVDLSTKSKSEKSIQVNNSEIDSSSNRSANSRADDEESESEGNATLTRTDMNYRNKHSSSDESTTSDSSTNSESTVVPANYQTLLDDEYGELSTSFDDVSISNSDSEYEKTSGRIETEAKENSETKDSPQRQLSQRANKGVPPQRFQANLIIEPKTLTEALSSQDTKEKWLQAMKEEMESHKDNNTWELCDLPEGRKAIGCKWVFKTKVDSSGKIKRFKARLVAKGFTQKFGEDYDQVFAPVAKQTTFRILLSIASAKKLLVHHLDVKTAFLNGKLSETIYMKQPPGFENQNKNLVCRLKRGIYGLKQAAKLWNDEIHRALTSKGFERSKADPCLYSMNMNGEMVYVLIYVDDMAIVAKSTQTMNKVKSMLTSQFKTQDLGEIKHYLGIEVTRDCDDIFHLNQSQYIRKIVNEFGLSSAKASDVPIHVSYGKASSNSDDSLILSNAQYQKLLGCLLYVSVNTRPDIAASISILAQKVSQPRQEDWNELKRVLKYLKGTADLKLALGYKNYSGEFLLGYSDANWAEDKTNRKSNSGHVFLINGAAVCWSARKQSLVALSTCEAEFVALSEACRAASWIRKLLIDMKESMTKPTTILEDNQSCLNLVEQEERLSDRSKHIDTRFHFVKDYIKSGLVACKYCPTEKMLADVLTKPIAAAKFKQFRSHLGLHA